MKKISIVVLTCLISLFSYAQKPVEVHADMVGALSKLKSATEHIKDLSNGWDNDKRNQLALLYGDVKASSDEIIAEYNAIIARPRKAAKRYNKFQEKLKGAEGAYLKLRVKAEEMIKQKGENPGALGIPEIITLALENLPKFKELIEDIANGPEEERREQINAQKIAPWNGSSSSGSTNPPKPTSNTSKP